MQKTDKIGGMLFHQLHFMEILFQRYSEEASKIVYKMRLIVIAVFLNNQRVVLIAAYWVNHLFSF